MAQDRNVVEAEDHAGTRQDRKSVLLRRSVFGLLVMQVVLSICILALSFSSEGVSRSLSALKSAAAEQKLAFQEIGLTTRRLLSEIEKEQPNPRLLAQIQRNLSRNTAELEAAIDTIRAGTTMKIGLFSLQARETRADIVQLEPVIDSFMQDMRRMSAAGPDRLLNLRSKANRVALVISPNGEIGRAIDALLEEVSRNAERIQVRLSFLKIGAVVLIITIVLAMGARIVLPMTTDLSKALMRERDLRRHMQNMARMDGLTGLLNREGLEHAVGKLPPDTCYAYVLIDLNLFKPINDTFGHMAGDAVLVELARRLQKIASKETITARIGGDEFVLVDPSVNCLKAAVQCGRRLVGMFNDPVRFDEREFDVSGAIGLALSAETDGSLDGVATAADAAMYTVKGSGRTEFAIYSEDIEIRVPDLGLKSELEQAIAQDAIVPWYQPKLNLITGEIAGFEALARWPQSTGDMRYPGHFLPQVAEFGLQQHLTLSMLRQVLSQMRDWKSDGKSILPISVNVPEAPLASATGLQDILNLLDREPDLTPYLIFEITEDVFLPRIANAVKEAVLRLSEKGVEISMDDFGTGYASFRHLHEFTFHELKIDRTFVDGIGHDTSAEVILQAFMSIANGLGIRVVAEGIETTEQAKYMTALGCDLGQGFLYGKPVSPEQVNSVLASNSLAQGMAS